MLLYNAQEPTDFESYQEQGDIGFLSVAGAQFDTFKYEDLSTSRGRNLDEELLKEVHKVHDLAPEMFGPSFLPAFESSSTEILKESWRQATQGNIGMLQGGLQLALANSIASTKSKDSLSSDWQGIIEPNLEALRERFPDANIRNRDEIDADIAAQAKMLRDDFEETYSYADPYAAFFGTLGGGAVASMADPINIMTLPIGAGKVAGASFVQGLSIIVARSFGIGFATEAAIQPLVYDYKKEIESPYDLQDALFNMSAAGVGNGLLNGLGHSIARGFDRITSKQELPDNHETRRLRKEIQDLLELQTFADETGAKTVGELEVHLKALNTAMADIEAGRQVDYDSLGKTIEAEYLELFDVEVNGARATMDYIAQKRYELEESFDPDLYAKQEQLQKFADQKLTKWELKQAQNKADIETTGELNQETDLDAIREIQKADFDRSVGEDTIRQNEEANIANNDLRASRRDEGDMIALKQQMDDLDNKYSEQVDYHSAAKKARDQYVVDKAEETNQAIAVAPTDTPRMMAVKTAVNRIAASMGANDIKVRVYEGNPELDGDMRFSVDDGEGSAAWKAAEAKGLDMSQEGRMARAKAMGFDTTTVYYHGASRGGYNRTSDIEAFDPEKIGDKWGQDREGFFFTTNKNEAGYYATTDSIGNNVSGGTIYPIYHRSENPFIIDSKNDVDLAGEGGVPYWDNNHIELIKAAKKGGHDSIRLIDRGAYENQLEEMLVLFDPSKIRSVNAAFDPDLIDSPNLRYSLADKDITSIGGVEGVTIKDDLSGSVKIDKDGKNVGEIKYTESNGVVQIKRSDVEIAGKGIGTNAYAQFISQKIDEGKIVTSDAIVSTPAQRVYEKLKDLGFTLKKADDTRLLPNKITTLSREDLKSQRQSFGTVYDKESGVRSVGAGVYDGPPVYTIGLPERYSKSGSTIEAAINPETGELHINASAFRDEAHLMQVMREEIIGHYGLRKSLGGDFQGVINDIKSTALTNPELRQMWVDLSGIDPQTRQIINPNAPYKGMADDVIADEIISKMAREEVSDTTFMALKNIIIKALRKIGLVKDDITISEMRALVVKSEQALKKNVVKKPTITGMKPQLKQIDEPLNNEAIDAEAARIVSDETTDQVIFDQNGNTINLRDALMEDDNDIAGIESIRVCML